MPVLGCVVVLGIAQTGLLLLLVSFSIQIIVPGTGATYYTLRAEEGGITEWEAEINDPLLGTAQT